MREDVTYVTSSLIGWDLAHVVWHITWKHTLEMIILNSYFLHQSEKRFCCTFMKFNWQPRMRNGLFQSVLIRKLILNKIKGCSKLTSVLWTILPDTNTCERIGITRICVTRYTVHIIIMCLIFVGVLSDFCLRHKLSWCFLNSLMLWLILHVCISKVTQYLQIYFM